MLLSGEPEIGQTSDKNKRLVMSNGQDICRVVTDGEWKPPKHTLLCIIVRHLYRSKQLMTILFRLGYSESYSFALEMVSAISTAINEVFTFFNPRISIGEGNLIFHCEWDNLNKITTNIHGGNVVNSAEDVMIQESKPEF